MEGYGKKPKPARNTLISKVALFFCLVCFLLNIIAYTTPYWVRAKREIVERRKFDRLGLWEACFNDYRRDSGFYGKTYTGCHWILSQYYREARSWLTPGWFIAVQVLSTFVMLMLVTASAMLLMYFLNCCKPNHEKLTLLVSAALLIISGIIESVVVILFGVQGDKEGWIPRTDLNYFHWSYAFAVASAFFALFSGVLLVVESIQSGRRRQDSQRMPMREMRTT